MDHHQRYEDDVFTSIAEMRARSLKTVETVFGALVVLCAAVAALVHVGGASVGVAGDAQEAIAFSFLALAVVDLGLLFGCRAWLMRGVEY